MKDYANKAKCTHDFYIRLANEESWQFISTSEANNWLVKLCSIMRLNECVETKSHKIIFLKNLFGEHNQIKSINSNEIRMWNTGPLRIHQCLNTSHMICELGDTDPDVNLFKMAQSVLPIYTRVLYHGGVPLHAALIEREGIGVAIAAPGGTGKTTCTQRIPHPWQVLCDDETLIVRDKKDIYQAHPFPTWSRCNTQESGETWNVQAHIPISTIFFLKKSLKDQVNLLSFSQSALLTYKLSLSVYNRTFRYMDNHECIFIKRLIFENACDIAKNIPAFILEASLNGKFWKAMDKALHIDTEGD